jgi:DNA-binding CsgD family transcriptional regulator
LGGKEMKNRERSDGEGKVDWGEIDPLLGLMNDKEICSKFPIHREAAQKRRAALNIPAYKDKNSKKWLGIDPLLGTMTDREIALKHGVNRNTIMNRRKALGVPAFEKHNWPEIDRLIGKIPDKEIAKIFNVPENTLYLRRKRLRIPNKRDRKEISWPDIDPILGTMPDSKIAQMFQIGGGQVITRRREKLGIGPFNGGAVKVNWAEIDYLLGSAPDGDIADRFGISRTSVSFRRRILGIPSIWGTSSRKSEICWEVIEPLLGTMTDAKLAQQYGISPSAVHKRRRLLGIKAYYQPVDWSRHEKSLREYDASSQQIAREAGVTKAAVLRVRTKLMNIEWRDRVECRKNSKKVDWGKIREDFASMTDREISEKHGVSIATAWRNRQRLPVHGDSLA